jgi:hypothetical protein
VVVVGLVVDAVVISLEEVLYVVFLGVVEVVVVETVFVVCNDKMRICA